MAHAVRTSIAIAATLGVVLAMGAITAAPASAAVTAITVTGPTTAPIGSNIVYTLQFSADAAGCANATVTIPAADNLTYVLSSKASATAVGNAVTVPLGALLPSSVTQFTVTYTDSNLAQATYPTAPAVALSGAVVTCDASTATQVGAVNTAITGSYPYQPTKTGTVVPGSNNRVIDYGFSLSRTDNNAGVFGIGAFFLVDIIPSGAQIVHQGSGWDCSTAVGTDTQCIYAGGAVSASTAVSGLQVFYPASTFPADYAPVNTVNGYYLQNGGDAATFDPSDTTPAAPFHAMTPAIVTLPGTGNGDPSAVPSVTGKKTVSAGLENIEGHSPGSGLTNGAHYRYNLETSVLNGAQTTVEVNDNLNGVDNHFLVGDITSTLSVAAEDANLTGEFVFTFSDGSTATNISPLNGLHLYVGEASNVFNSAGARVVAPNGTRVTGIAATYYRANGGSAAALGIPGGSTITLSIDGIASFADYETGLSGAPVLLHNCYTAEIQPQDVDSGSQCAVDEPIVDSISPYLINTNGTITSGENGALGFRMMNYEPVRTVSGLVTYLVLPTGIFYNPAGTMVQGDGVPLATLPTITTRLQDDGRQVVAMAWPTLEPDHGYAATNIVTYFPYNGRAYSFPISATPSAYNPPASDSAYVPSWGAATAATLAAFGGQYGYNYYLSRNVDTDDVNHNNNSTEQLPWVYGALRVLASGTLAIGELTSDADGRAFSPSTVVSSGAHGVYQLSIGNQLPTSVTGVRLYDVLPASGDDAGSEFTPVLTGAPTGLPAGWTVQYSTSENACRAPLDPDPAGCAGDFTSFTPGNFELVKSFRVIATTILTGANIAIEVPVRVPGATLDGLVAVNSFDIFGTSAGSDFGPVTSASAELVAAVDSDGSIGDFVWDDTNGNGDFDPGETGLAGVVITIVDEANVVVFTATTTSTGEYLATGLSPGTYTVTFDHSAITDRIVSPVGDGYENVGAVFSVTLSGDGDGGTSSEFGADFAMMPIPELSIVKTADRAKVTAAGQVIRYTFVVTNNGVAEISDIVVTDTLTAPAAPALSLDCDATSLVAAASFTCIADYTVTTADIANGSVVNSAVADGEVDGEAITSNVSTATVLAEAPAISDNSDENDSDSDSDDGASDSDLASTGLAVSATIAATLALLLAGLALLIWRRRIRA